MLNPIKLTIENYPEDQIEQLDAVNNPEDESYGKRTVPFSRDLLIEAADFLEEAPRRYHRLAIGREVRLRYGYLVTCTGCVKDDDGNVVEVLCKYDPETRGGNAPDGRKIKGTIHWVSARHAVDVELRLYDRLFTTEKPGDVPEGEDWKTALNPDSLTVNPTAKLEPSVVGAEPGTRYQFERTGYFCVDPDTTPENLVMNRTVTLRDTWAKVQKKGGK